MTLLLVIPYHPRMVGLPGVEQWRGSAGFSENVEAAKLYCQGSTLMVRRCGQCAVPHLGIHGSKESCSEKDWDPKIRE